DHWLSRASGIRVIRPTDLTAGDGLHRRIDRRLDTAVGFYPLSLRQSIRHGFNRGRMQPGHQNWFLDPTRAGPLPKVAAIDSVMTRWHYGRLRYVPPALRRRLERERPTLALANTQMHSVVPFVVAARRAGVP